MLNALPVATCNAFFEMSIQPAKPPGEALRVLFVEDREEDMELTLRELRRAGFATEYARVETAEGMKAVEIPAAIRRKIEGR